MKRADKIVKDIIAADVIDVSPFLVAVGQELLKESPLPWLIWSSDDQKPKILQGYMYGISRSRIHTRGPHGAVLWCTAEK